MSLFHGYGFYKLAGGGESDEKGCNGAAKASSLIRRERGEVRLLCLIIIIVDLIDASFGDMI